MNEDVRKKVDGLRVAISCLCAESDSAAVAAVKSRGYAVIYELLVALNREKEIRECLVKLRARLECSRDLARKIMAYAREAVG